MGKKKQIPDGWLDYSPIGKPIPGTIIICFKVPLEENKTSSIPATQRFSPSMLLGKVPNLHGVIDVTNTPRYYDKQVFLDRGIQHEKVRSPGHVVPPGHVVCYFQKVMQRMWADAESVGEKLVGVHCTHGINRTGYLVCRYLIECRGFHPEEAIKLFAESRGHGIERENYLSDLRRLTPGHHSPESISLADFLNVEHQRRNFWNTDANFELASTRHDDHGKRRPAAAVGPMIHACKRPLLHTPYGPPPPHRDGGRRYPHPHSQPTVQRHLPPLVAHPHHFTTRDHPLVLPYPTTPRTFPSPHPLPDNRHNGFMRGAATGVDSPQWSRRQCQGRDDDVVHHNRQPYHKRRSHQYGEAYDKRQYHHGDVSHSSGGGLHYGGRHRY